MQTDVTRMTMTEAAELIEARKLSPVELTQAHLNRIAQVDPLLNAFITLIADSALAAAREAEAEIARGDTRGALHGIPIGLKDLYETAGVRTTVGAKFYADHVPAKDAFVVAQLKAAGAIILGKLNLHEIALGVTTDNPHYGTCRNPWDTARSPGGSSGGSGAALAAGLCMGALGSDTRGSIRIPASLCGVVGLKPTYGAISVRGVLPLAWSLDHAGPMARTVADAALLFEILSAYDAQDAYMAEARPAARFAARDDLRGVSVGVARDAFFREASAEVLAGVERAVGLLRELGARVIDIDLGFMEEARRTSQIIVQAEAAALYADRLAKSPEAFGADVRRRLLEGAKYPATDYANARRSGVLLRHRLLAAFDAAQIDAVITPSTPMTAPRFDDAAELDAARAGLSRFTAPFNMTGFPALSLPFGQDSRDMPIGLQIVARPWAEQTVLQIGEVLERATGGSQGRIADLPG